MASNIYYKIDGNNIYYSNQAKVGYDLKEDNSKLSDGKNVIVKLNQNNQFIFPTGDGFPENASYLFYGATNTSFSNIDKWVVDSNSTTLRGLFQNCVNVTSLDLSGWDTSNVYDLTDMFNGCTNLSTLNTSTWNTSHVNSMARMFKGCSSFEELFLNHFSVAGVETVANMFENCTSAKLISIKGWDFGSGVQKYVNVTSMFENCTSLLCVNANSTNFKNVNWADRVFYNCGELRDVVVSENTDWYSDLHPSMKNMFYGCINIYNYDRTVNGETKANDREGGYFKVGDVVPSYKTTVYEKAFGYWRKTEIYEKFSGNWINIEEVTSYNG